MTYIQILYTNLDRNLYEFFIRIRRYTKYKVDVLRQENFQKILPVTITIERKVLPIQTTMYILIMHLYVQLQRI